MKKLVAVLVTFSLLVFVAIVYAQGHGMMGSQKDQPQMGRGMMQGMGCYGRDISRNYPQLLCSP